jgi:hypothetical protein
VARRAVQLATQLGRRNVDHEQVEHVLDGGANQIMKEIVGRSQGL